MRFSKRAFKAWLESKVGRSVGNPTNRHYCPLCEFLRAQGAEDVIMMPSYRQVDGKGTDNPIWARKFQHNAMNHVEHRGWVTILAEEALTCLR